jgi:hypothetical protein
MGLRTSAVVPLLKLSAERVASFEAPVGARVTVIV